MKEINAKIEKHSESIAEYLSEIKLWDNARVVPAIAVRVKAALHDLIKLYTIDLETEKNALLKEFNEYGITKRRKAEIQAALSENRQKRKSINGLHKKWNDESDRDIIMKFLKENHSNVWQEIHGILPNR